MHLGKTALALALLTLSLAPAPLRAQEGFIGEVRMFAGNYAPRTWMFCQGQTLQISQYSALFSILGTTYGGDGRTTFRLPDLRGRVPIGSGQGPGLTPYMSGQMFGSETTTDSQNQMPAHTHGVAAGTGTAAAGSRGGLQVLTPGTGTNLSSAPAGGSQAQNNMQPSLAINYIICIEGVYPSRS